MYILNQLIQPNTHSASPWEIPLNHHFNDEKNSTSNKHWKWRQLVPIFKSNPPTLLAEGEKLALAYVLM